MNPDYKSDVIARLEGLSYRFRQIRQEEKVSPMCQVRMIELAWPELSSLIHEIEHYADLMETDLRWAAAQVKIE